MTPIQVLKRLLGYIFPTLVLRLSECLLTAAHVACWHPKITGLEVGQDLKKRQQIGFPSCCCAFFLGEGEVKSQLLTAESVFHKNGFKSHPPEIRWGLQSPFFWGGGDYGNLKPKNWGAFEEFGTFGLNKPVYNLGFVTEYKTCCCPTSPERFRCRSLAAECPNITCVWTHVWQDVLLFHQNCIF